MAGPTQLAKRMFQQSVYAAWCEGQQGSTHSLNDLKLAVGEPIWLKSSDSLANIPSILDEAQEKSLQGLLVLACVPYEAAPAFDPALKVSAMGSPLSTVMAFAPEQVLSWAEFSHLRESNPSIALHFTPWLNENPQSWFDESFDRVRDWIASGDFYQINLTTRLRATVCLPKLGNASSDSVLFELFLRLFQAQPAAFSMYLRLPGQTIMSLSPELFFTWDKGRIVTAPMKGTRKPNGLGPRLEDSTKDRAENLMIVDLLRNDLARVCLPRTVQAESLFDVMTLPSVEQMTSTISGLTRPALKVSALFEALFPCGSVTGAPKAQSMKRIAQLETSPRGVYCGALGLFKPQGSMRFSVPIRTLVVEPPAENCTRLKLEYGVGSGLTWYSNKQEEHQEWWQKTVFLRKQTLDFSLLETVRLEHRIWHNADLHLQRMKNAAQRFSYVWNDVYIRAKLQQVALEAGEGPYRARCLLSPGGEFEVQLFPLEGALPNKIRLALANRPIEDALLEQGLELGDYLPFIEHKTTYRPHYEAFTGPVFDTVLYTKQGHLTESCRFNLVLEVGGQFVTPILQPDHEVENQPNNSVKLLNGVLRQRLLSENRIQEIPLHIGDLSRAEGVWLINSLRSWVRVDEIVNQDGDLIYRTA